MVETMSGIPLDPFYGAELQPGDYPFTRGLYPTGYRSKLWTMRMFAGFGTATDTNARFHALLRAGGTGLSTAFDMPTLMGRDSDHDWSQGEVGRAGVAVDTLADMEDLFAGIELDKVTTSMTINGPAAILMAMYIAVARKERCESGRPRRHNSKRHTEGVPGPKGVHLPATPVGAPGYRSDPLHHCGNAPLASGVNLRLPHPRGRFGQRPKNWRSRWPTASPT